MNILLWIWGIGIVLFVVGLFVGMIYSLFTTKNAVEWDMIIVFLFIITAIGILYK